MADTLTFLNCCKKNILCWTLLMKGLMVWVMVVLRKTEGATVEMGMSVRLPIGRLIPI